MVPIGPSFTGKSDCLEFGAPFRPPFVACKAFSCINNGGLQTSTVDFVSSLTFSSS